MGALDGREEIHTLHRPVFLYAISTIAMLTRPLADDTILSILHTIFFAADAISHAAHDALMMLRRAAPRSMLRGDALPEAMIRQADDLLV